MICPRCGKEINDNSKYCSECGERIEEVKVEVEPEIMDDEYTKEDIENNKVLSLFSYISFLFIIPLIACSNSKYAKFHVNQGIMLCITNVVFEAILKALKVLELSFAYDIADAIVNIGLTVFMVIGIVNAVTGKAKKLPIIGNFTIIK